MPNKYLDSVGLAEYTTLIKTALDDKADLASPALTGTPTAPTPTAGDDSTKIATTAFVQDEVANYLPLTGGSVTGNLTVSGTITGNVTGTASGNLPLSGGTMTGTLYSSQNDFFTISKTDGVLNQGVRIWGGYGYSGGASLYLYGKNHSSAGDFSLCAHDGTNAKALAGHANGTLTWGGTSISLNGHTHSYLPLSGGTMTGEIIRNTYVVKNSVDNSFTEYMGGKDETSSYFVLYGKNHSSTPGRINLRANNGTKNSYLTLDPNGSMTWGGVSLTDGNFLTTRSVSVNASSGTAGYTITAPAVSRYKFICWYMSASSGNVYPTYIADSNTSSTKVWAINPINNTSIVCFALYVRKW